MRGINRLSRRLRLFERRWFNDFVGGLATMVGKDIS